MSSHKNPKHPEDLLPQLMHVEASYLKTRRQAYKEYKREYFQMLNQLPTSSKIHMTYLNFVNLITKNAVVATIVMTIALGGMTTAAAQFFAPEEYKPSNILFPQDEKVEESQAEASTYKECLELGGEVVTQPTENEFIVDHTCTFKGQSFTVMVGASCDVPSDSDEPNERGIWNDQGECAKLNLPEGVEVPTQIEWQRCNYEAQANGKTKKFSLQIPVSWTCEMVDTPGASGSKDLRLSGENVEMRLNYVPRMGCADDNPEDGIAEKCGDFVIHENDIYKVFGSEKSGYALLGGKNNNQDYPAIQIDAVGVDSFNQLKSKELQVIPQVIDSIKLGSSEQKSKTSTNINTSKTYVDAQFPNLQIPYPDSWEVARLQEAPNAYHDYWLHIASFQKEGLTLHYEIKTWDISSQKTSTTKCTQNNNLFVPAGNSFYRIRQNDESRIYKSNSSLKEDTTSVAPDQPLQGDPNNQWVDNPPRNITFEACYFPEIYPQTKSTNDKPNQGIGTEIEIKLLGVTDQNWKYLDEADQIVASTKF